MLHDLIGLPYRWQTSPPSSTDCLGLALAARQHFNAPSPSVDWVYDTYTEEQSELAVSSVVQRYGTRITRPEHLALAVLNIRRTRVRRSPPHRELSVGKQMLGTVIENHGAFYLLYVGKFSSMPTLLNISRWVQSYFRLNMPSSENLVYLSENMRQLKSIKKN